MPASALLLAASAASLNLCTDEYLLLLARPGEIASVSYLSGDALESSLWRLGRRHHRNRGSIEDVVALRPRLMLTMGGGGRATALIATRLKIRTIELRPVASLDDVAANLRLVAAELGEPGRARPWLDRLAALRGSAPRHAKDAIWVSGGGDSLEPGSVGAQWLRLAGLRQRPLEGGRATLEALTVHPPQVLVRSVYRPGQAHRGARWWQHPVVRRLEARQLTTDDRAWRCRGPLMIGEIKRLRAAAR